MGKIPGSQGVRQAIKVLQTAVKKSIKGMNQKAGHYMSRGEYERAQAIAETARTLHQFVEEIEALRAKWNALGSKPVKKQKMVRLPLWRYYQPILAALVQAGGEATARSLEPLVEKNLAGDLGSGDRAMVRAGVQQWQRMIRRARKHLAAEGWIEPRSSFRWKITEAGKKASTGRQFSGPGKMG